MSDAPRQWEAVPPGMMPKLASDGTPPTTNGPIWRVPHERNQNFAGRDRLLASLHGSLQKSTHVTRTVVLVGPAGVGKTQIAAEYAHRHRDEYTLIYWLRAKTEEQLEHDIYALARDLRGGSFDGSVAAARMVIRKELAGRSNWLVIFDGAVNTQGPSECLPPRHSGHVLITSRDMQWRSLGTAGVVPPMERGESIYFLKARTERTKETVVAAGQLAKALGDFPLALELASVVINEAKLSFDEYIRRFENIWAEMLASSRGTTRDALALSLEMSLRQLASMAPAAAELLNLLSFFGSEGFQRAWLTLGEKVLVNPLATTVREFAFLQEALQWLARFSMIELKGGQITLDQTVADYVRSRLSHEEFTEHAHVALRLMDNAFRFDANDPRTWSEGMAMLPHASAVIEHSQKTDVTVAAAASLLNQVGQCLHRNGRYDKARAMLDKALAIGYRIYGEDNSRLSAIANNLGRVLLRLGETGAARAQFEWSLALDEKTYGPTHPHVAEILNNYGLCLIRLGERALAVQQFERALDIYETQCGPSHPSTASIINNIGYTKTLAGDLTGSWELLQRALGVVHATYGPNHPDVASILLNLGDVLRAQGSFAVARAQYQRAMLIDEICYGANHPDVARDAGHLGKVLIDLNDHAEARKYFERALSIDEAVFGPRHSNVIPRLDDLGRCLQLSGDADGARGMRARSADLRKLLLPEGKADSNDSSTAAA